MGRGSGKAVGCLSRGKLEAVPMGEISGDGPHGGADAHLPGRAAVRVHRHGASQHRCGLVRAGAGPIPGSAAGTPKRQVRGAWRDRARRRRMDRMPVGPPRFVLPPIRRGVGRVRGPGRPVRLRQFRRHAGTNLGDRARPRLAGATMGGAAIRSRCRAEQALFHPHLQGDKHVHKPLRLARRVHHGADELARRRTIRSGNPRQSGRSADRPGPGQPRSRRPPPGR